MFKKIIFVFLFIVNLSAQPIYDGLWFMGFNLNREIFKGEEGKRLRYFIAQNIDREKKCREIFETELKADNFIYPQGNYEPIPLVCEIITGNISLKGKKYSLVLLCSDGIKTVTFAKAVKTELASKNIVIEIKKINTTKYNNWEEALKAGNYDLFLMGFKSEYEQPVQSFLVPLYLPKGYANFMGYNNPVVSKLIGDLENISLNNQAEILKMIDKNIAVDLPLLPVFFIEQIN